MTLVSMSSAALVAPKEDEDTDTQTEGQDQQKLVSTSCHSAVFYPSTGLNFSQV